MDSHVEMLQDMIAEGGRREVALKEICDREGRDRARLEIEKEVLTNQNTELREVLKDIKLYIKTGISDELTLLNIKATLNTQSYFDKEPK